MVGMILGYPAQLAGIQQVDQLLQIDKQQKVGVVFFRLWNFTHFRQGVLAGKALSAYDSLLW